MWLMTFAWWGLSALPLMEFMVSGRSFYCVMALTLFIGGAVIPIVCYIKSTDGIDHWEIRLPNSLELCEAMESEFDRMLKAEGYQYWPGRLYSVYNKKSNKEPYGRNYIISTSPAMSGYLAYNNGPDGQNPEVMLDFAFRPGSKYVPPYLTIELRDIQEANYYFVLALQKKVMGSLTSLNYRSFKPAQQQ